MKKTTTTTKPEEDLYKPLMEGDEEDLKPLKKQTIVTAAPASRGLSCCCKCVLITVALLFALVGIATYAMYSAMGDLVVHLTVPTPHDKFPIVDMTEAELEAVKERIDTFFEELLAGKAKSPLEVTQDEINGFIGHSDYLRGNMFVTLKDGAIEEEFSLSTDMFPGGRGRYFVGDEYLKLEEDEMEVKFETAATHHDWFDGPLLFAQLQYLVSTDNLLELYLTKGSFFGQEASQEFIDKHQNLLEGFYNDPDSKDARVIVENIEYVNIEPGKIVVIPRKH